MPGKYIDHLSHKDPLYGFLVHDILQRIDIL